MRRRAAGGPVAALAAAGSLALLGAIVVAQAPWRWPPGPSRSVRAGQPFLEHDPGGASLVCISDRAGTILPPYLTAP